MRKSRSDMLAGTAFLALAALFGVQLGELTGISRVFPESLLIFVALGGVYFVLKGLWALWRERAEGPKAPVDEPPMSAVSAKSDAGVGSVGGDDGPVAWGRIGTIAALAVVYALALKPVGFFTSTFTFLFLAVLTLGDASPPPARRAMQALLFASLFCLAIWVGFVKLLSVPTPVGIFM